MMWYYFCDPCISFTSSQVFLHPHFKLLHREGFIEKVSGVVSSLTLGGQLQHYCISSVSEINNFIYLIDLCIRYVHVLNWSAGKT